MTSLGWDSVVDDALQDNVLLTQAWQCWSAARGDRVLPFKGDYEKAILGFPDIIPNLTIVEWTDQGSLRYLMIGSNIVKRRSKEQTSEIVKDVMEIRAERMLYEWARSSTEERHGTYFETYTDLPSGTIGIGRNLGLPLFGDQERVTLFCLVTQVDDTYGSEVGNGGFEIASAGISFRPIDLGFGVGTMRPISVGAAA